MAVTAIDGLAFRVDGDEYTWRDVVAAAQARGDWQGVEQEVREGLAAARLAEAAGTATIRDEEHDAAAAFRYARRLLAAEDMDAWLRQWDITVGDWMAWIRRSLMRERYPADDQRISAIDGADVDRLTFSTAVLSGDLERFAQTLAIELVVPAPPVPAPPEVAREIERRMLDWTRVDYERVAFLREPMAREALLWVAEDGHSLDDVAEVATVYVEREQVNLEDVPEPLRSVLIAADPGDVRAPVTVENGFAVVRLRSKTIPTVENDAVVRQAEAAIIKRVIQSQLDERVRWA